VQHSYILAVTYSHIQEAATHKDIKYIAITIPLCSVGNVYWTCIECIWELYYVLFIFQDALLEMILTMLYNLLQFNMTLACNVNIVQRCCNYIVLYIYNLTKLSTEAV
jgi:hypothetical protein